MASEHGCPIEMHRIQIDKCDEMYDEKCDGTTFMPFHRASYDPNTGQSPNNPREQVREREREGCRRSRRGAGIEAGPRGHPPRLLLLRRSVCCQPPFLPLMKTLFNALTRAVFAAAAAHSLIIIVITASVRPSVRTSAVDAADAGEAVQ